MKRRLANLGLECLGHAASEFQVKAVGEDLWRSVSGAGLQFCLCEKAVFMEMLLADVVCHAAGRASSVCSRESVCVCVLLLRHNTAQHVGDVVRWSGCQRRRSGVLGT